MYQKSTFVSCTRNSEHYAFHMHGFVRLENALARAGKLGAVATEISHLIYDGSGRGRGGLSDKWKLINEKWVKI